MLKKGCLLLSMLFLLPNFSTAEEQETVAQRSEKQNESGTISKWCSKSESGKIRYINNSAPPEGFSKCGSVSTVAHCDIYGNTIFAKPGVSVPHEFQPCSNAPKLYLENNGKPVDIAQAMWANSTGAASEGRDSSLNSSAAELPERKPLGEAYGDMRKLLDARTSRRGELAAGDAFQKIEEILEPLLNGTIGRTYKEALGQDTSSISDTGRLLDEHFRQFEAIDDSFFND